MSTLYFAGKGYGSRPRHVDAAVVFIVIDVQGTQGEAHVNAAARIAVQVGRHRCRARARAAGQSCAGTAFPRTYGNSLIVYDLCKVDVRFLGKVRMMLEKRTQTGHVYGRKIADVRYRMGHAEKKGGNLIGLAVYDESFINDVMSSALPSVSAAIFGRIMPAPVSTVNVSVCIIPVS